MLAVTDSSSYVLSAHSAQETEVGDSTLVAADPQSPKIPAFKKAEAPDSILYSELQIPPIDISLGGFNYTQDVSHGPNSGADDDDKTHIASSSCSIVSENSATTAAAASAAESDMLAALAAALDAPGPGPLGALVPELINFFEHHKLSWDTCLPVPNAPVAAPPPKRKRGLRAVLSAVSLNPRSRRARTQVTTTATTSSAAEDTEQLKEEDESKVAEVFPLHTESDLLPPRAELPHLEGVLMQEPYTQEPLFSIRSLPTSDSSSFSSSEVDGLGPDSERRHHSHKKILIPHTPGALQNPVLLPLLQPLDCSSASSRASFSSFSSLSDSPAAAQYNQGRRADPALCDSTRFVVGSYDAPLCYAGADADADSTCSVFSSDTGVSDIARSPGRSH